MTYLNFNNCFFFTLERIKDYEFSMDSASHSETRPPSTAPKIHESMNNSNILGRRCLFLLRDSPSRRFLIYAKLGFQITLRFLVESTFKKKSSSLDPNTN